MNIFQRFYASLRLREAIRQANEAHAQTGRRYYVMPVQGGGGKLVIVDRQNFRVMKRKHYIAQKSTVHDLVRECFYLTPYSDGNGWLAEPDARRKRMQYFAFCEAERRARRQKRK